MLRVLRQYIADRRFRTRYPILYDDNLQLARLLTLANQFRGKTIAVVGNAQSILQCQSGTSIDSAGVVIRINEGYPLVPKSQGTRTDVVCLATPTEPETIKAMFGSPEIIFVSPRRAVMSPMLAQEDSVAALPFPIWSSISGLLQGARPSAGLMATWISRNIFDASEVRLYGFDWKTTKTLYADKLRAKHHDWKLERQLMEQWAGEGWLKLPSADLELNGSNLEQ